MSILFVLFLVQVYLYCYYYCCLKLKGGNLTSKIVSSIVEIRCVPSPMIEMMMKLFYMMMCSKVRIFFSHSKMRRIIDENFRLFVTFNPLFGQSCTQCYRWTVKHEDCWEDNNNEGSRYYCWVKLVFSLLFFLILFVMKKCDEEGGDQRLRWDEFRRSERDCENFWTLACIFRVSQSLEWKSRLETKRKRIQDEELHLLLQLLL